MFESQHMVLWLTAMPIGTSLWRGLLGLMNHAGCYGSLQVMLLKCCTFQAGSKHGWRATAAVAGRGWYVELTGGPAQIHQMSVWSLMVPLVCPMAFQMLLQTHTGSQCVLSSHWSQRHCIPVWFPTARTAFARLPGRHVCRRTQVSDDMVTILWIDASGSQIS